MPWLNIVILTLLALMLRRLWVRFRRRTIDPLMGQATETWDGVELRARDKRRIWRKWLDRRQGKN